MLVSLRGRRQANKALVGDAAAVLRLAPHRLIVIEPSGSQADDVPGILNYFELTEKYNAHNSS